MTNIRIRPGPLLALLSLAQFMLVLDFAVIAVAVPSLQRDLGIAPADVQWIVTAYGLTFGGFLVAAGRAADLIGPRRVLVAGLVVFSLASVACGLAGEGGQIFVARAVQGFGAALVSPAALALITTSFSEGPARNRALGIWGAVASGGYVAGNLVGGLLTGLVHWRAIFLVNVPIGVALLVALLWFVPADRPVARGRTDVTGASLLTAAAVLLVTAVTQAERGITPLVVATALAGAVAAAMFFVVERRAKEPIVPLRMLRNRHVRYGNLVSLVGAGSGLAGTWFATLYMQNVLGLDPLQTGLAFVPTALVLVGISARVAPLVAHFGVRGLLLASSGLIAAGLAALTFIQADGNYWVHVLPGLVLIGAGAALAFAPSFIVGTTGVPNEEQGLASGMLTTSQLVGSSLSLAVLNTLAARATDATSLEGLTTSYRTGLLWALFIPGVMALCVLGVPRRPPTPEAPEVPAAAPGPVPVEI
jgi:EmrB/QacA subfamily drug resistance transporter